MDNTKLKNLTDEAHKLSREGKWGAAIAKWDDIILLLSDDSDRAEARAEAYYHRGCAKIHMNAVADFDHVLEINPRHERAIHRRIYALGLYTARGEQGKAPYLDEQESQARQIAKPKKQWWKTLPFGTALLSFLAALLAFCRKLG